MAEGAGVFRPLKIGASAPDVLFAIDESPGLKAIDSSVAFRGLKTPAPSANTQRRCGYSEI